MKRNTFRRDKNEIKDALTGRAIAEHYGVKWRQSGTVQARSQTCPIGGTHGGDTPFHFRLDDGRWDCKVCCVSGDSLALIAAYEGLDTTKNFERVLEIADVIAGDPTSRAAVIHKLSLAAARINPELAEGYEGDSHDKAKEVWDLLGQYSRHSGCQSCRDYLKVRGCGRLIGKFDIVRDSNSDPGNKGGRVRRVRGPSVALYSLRDSRIINVATRQAPDVRSENGTETWHDTSPVAKVMMLGQCSTLGTMIHSLAEVERHGGAIIVAEGITDSLTAVLAFPDAIVVGANGASRMAVVTEAVARIAAAQGRHVHVAADNDDPGLKGAHAARRAARAAGLAAECCHTIDLEGCKDLNEWWLMHGGEL